MILRMLRGYFDRMMRGPVEDEPAPLNPSAAFDRDLPAVEAKKTKKPPAKRQRRAPRK